jgi:hypothetical protein
MNGKRVEWGETGPSNPGEYAKHPTAGWHCVTPNGHGANLSAHQVAEHEDGTITMSPSILVREVTAPGVGFVPYREASYTGELWHGFLERGVWRQC